MPAPDGYRHVTRLQVRFADLDVNSHLNHAKFLTYMEQARMLYTSEIVGVPFTSERARPQTRMILASIQVDYRRPVHFGEEILVHSRCPKLGNKSFQMEHILLAAGEEAAHAHSTIVAYDYGAGQSVPLPGEWRQRILDFEPCLRKKKEEHAS